MRYLELSESIQENQTERRDSAAAGFGCQCPTQDENQSQTT
jgi:hypothetical protein